MQVTVRLHATLRKFLPASSSGNATVLEMPAGATVGAVIDRLGIPREHAGMMVSQDDYLETTSVLREGQEVNLFPPLAGGAGRAHW